MSQTLWKVSLRAAPEAEEAVSQALAHTFGQAPCSFTNFGTGQTQVSVYLRQKPAWSAGARSRLQAELERLARRLHVETGKLSLTKLAPRDWAHSWKRHFKPIQIASTLLIRPSWSHKKPRQGQSLVILDPGLSFGTGHHPTTLFCLRQLAARRRPNQSQSVLDLGTGSGILAICAARLGYAPVKALDLDAEALRVARANASRNDVLSAIQFEEQDVLRLRRRQSGGYALICANLVSSVLLEARERIVSQLGCDGVLLAAGILKSEFCRVQAGYESAGLKLVASQGKREWRSGAFRFAASGFK